MTHVTTKELIDLLDDESNSISASYFPDIAQRLRELEAATQWQPIETAPKDGSLILVANSEGVWAAKYHPVFQSGFKPDNPWSSMLLNHDHIRFHKSSLPTRWMPLPAQPTTSQPTSTNHASL